MHRTIIGLFNDEAPDSLESNHTGDLSVQVEDVQQDLSGVDIYHGHAAKRFEEEVERPTIDPDTGEIGDEEVEDEWIETTEWIAVLDGGAPFVAVDGSAGTFFFDVVGINWSTIVKRGSYQVDVFAERIRNDYDAQFWGVNWSEGEDYPSGAYYPGLGSDDAGIIERAMEYEKPQVGFHYLRDGDDYKGVIAQSGYLALFDPVEDYMDLAQFLRQEAVTDAYIGGDDA